MTEKTIKQRFGVVNEFIKYFAASAIALSIDYATYWAIVQSNLMELKGAAVVGYMVGLVVAYFLISERVFSDGWLRERRSYEALLFALSGVLGIVLTYISVAFYVFAFGESVHGAKLLAIGISFIAVYLFRKLFVFRS